MYGHTYGMPMNEIGAARLWNSAGAAASSPPPSPRAAAASAATVRT